ncbi:protein-L-isoaspartate O-methyltransferase [Kangiella sp. TOML190]|uniref:protein-L-isoaspartate O-methyltransferase family protein n=1 Tax=Kangiella sp. TOML190 TaxID=2931351 RepID=UPI002041AEF0|nr:protein-L-isoaspartate O-methyltransferase [Kangiella sp. TOML190]
MQNLNQFNPEQARMNMVEQQIRPWQMFDNTVLDLFAAMPRHQFVPKDYEQLAYSDCRIPLSQNQYMMPPREEARMLQALKVQPSDLVLEVGSGSGFVSALLANLSHKVYSVDIIADYLEQAKNLNEDLGLTNIEFEEGDASNGWPHYGPYDAIAICGGFFELPISFKKSLAIGGRLFCFQGQTPAMQAKLITRVSEDKWLEENLFESDIELLINAKKPEKFIF